VKPEDEGSMPFRNVGATIQKTTISADFIVKISSLLFIIV
jgi:hypothetical protein